MIDSFRIMQDERTAFFVPNDMPVQRLEDVNVDKVDNEKGHLSRQTTRLSDAVGRQVELELANTIQYRTCSWQKVRKICT